jgi:hypothetical protein
MYFIHSYYCLPQLTLLLLELKSSRLIYLFDGMDPPPSLRSLLRKIENFAFHHSTISPSGFSYAKIRPKTLY